MYLNRNYLISFIYLHKSVMYLALERAMLHICLKQFYLCLVMDI